MIPKVLLINPPITTYGDDSPASIFIPIGLAYIAAHLRKYGYYVRILDALAEGELKKGIGYFRRGMSSKEIEKYIDIYKPDIVGISCMYTAYAKDAHQIAKIVKKINSKTLVVFGGSHASSNYHIVLKDPHVDLIVKGEGEQTFLEIVRSRQKRKKFDNIRGLILRDNGKFKINPERDFINDLDRISFPARDLLPRNIYYKMRSPYWMRFPLDVIVSSRGCPKRCIYCSIHSVWGNRWRARSATNVVDEIELLTREGVREIHFNDDNISVDRRRMHEICDEIIKRKLDIKWTTPNGIAIWTLDKELLIKMKKAGCYRLTFGIETGNQKMQKYIGKNLNLRYAWKLINWANDLGFWTVSTYIIGFPYETRKEMNDTFKFALSSGTDFALFYTLTPFPGTQIFETFRKEGLFCSNLNDLDKSKNFFVAEFSCKTKLFKKKEVSAIQTRMYRKFIVYRFLQVIFNPRKILKKIKKLDDLRYTLKLLKNFIGININLLRFGQMSAKVLYGRKK